VADLAITASQVLRISGNVETAYAGEAINAGQAVYKDTSTGILYKSDADASGKDGVDGIALNSAGTGQAVTFLKDGGEITLGAAAAPTLALIYILSATAGGICPASDLANPMKTTVIGVASSGTALKLDIFRSGYTKA
jgi:predicted transcriptional regulator